jgi:hypothetical protein
VSVPAGQAWICALQRKLMTISSFFCGQTRSSRVLIPTLPAYGGPISPTFTGCVGSDASTMTMPGCGCGHGLTPARGSPTPQVSEPSVRLPTYT